MNPLNRAAHPSGWWPTLVSLIAVLSCGLLVMAPPASAAESRPLPPFDAISLQAPVDVTVRQTGRESVDVKAAPAPLPLIEALVETVEAGGGAVPTLLIRVKPGQRLPAGARIHVDIEVARLRVLDMQGAGDVTVETLDTPALKLAIAGAGDARLHGLAAERFDIAIAGSGDVHADGRAGQLTLSIAGSGDVEVLGNPPSMQQAVVGSGEVVVRR